MLVPSGSSVIKKGFELDEARKRQPGSQGGLAPFFNVLMRFELGVTGPGIVSRWMKFARRGVSLWGCEGEARGDEACR